MDAEKERLLFYQVIMMFHTAGMQHLGKIHDAASNEIKRDLDQAQFMIDILDVLERKMKGNLAKDEEKFIGNALQELKLNYVDEAAKPDPPKSAT